MEDPHAPLTQAEVQAMKIIANATAKNLPDYILNEQLYALADHFQKCGQESEHLATLKVVGYLKSL